MLKDDYNFNYQVIINMLYLDKKPILYAINDITVFNVTRFLKDMSIKAAQDTI